MSEYEFVRGYPTEETVETAYDDADYCRAVQAYKFFYPTVAFSTGFVALSAVGVKTNQQGAMMTGSPKQSCSRRTRTRRMPSCRST
jgi:hypothetical protein